jgi:AraC-like DNA-binding protein
MTLLASIRVDTAPLPPSEQFAAWAATQPFYTVSQPAPADGFAATATGWKLGDLVISHQTLGLARFLRTARHIKADGADHYVLIALIEGWWSGQVGRRALECRAGEACLFDLGAPLDANAESKSIALLIPRASIDTAIEPFDMHGLVHRGIGARLLIDHLQSLIRQLPHMTEAEAPYAAAATLAMLLASLNLQRLAEAVPKPPSSPALLNRVKRHIARNLAHPLTAASICAALGTSRSALYRTMAPLGGVTAYVLERRLLRVHQLLGAADEPSSITALAQAHGFTSASQFSRAFRRAFGYSAAAYRARNAPAAEPAQPTGSDAQIYTGWTKTLD